MVVVLIAVGGFSIMLCILCKSTEPQWLKVGDFNLVEYQWEIEAFSLDKNVGPVNNQNIAIEKAKELWLEKYDDNGQSYNFISGRKVEVSYDSGEECWHIKSLVPRNTLGGVKYAIIRKNGEVVAVWIDD